eukprot:6763931-Alexandrium_andersonii.AAC.1
MRIRRAALPSFVPSLAVGDRTPAIPSAMGGSADVASEGSAIGGGDAAIGGEERPAAVGSGRNSAVVSHLS